MSRHRRWDKLRLLPGRVGLLLEAACWLCLARVMLVLVRFPRIARHLGQLRPPSGAIAGLDADVQKHVAARRVAWAISRSARMLPFDLVCLPRALAGMQMLNLRRVPGNLHFGAARDQARKELRTHVWLEACGVEITGYPVAGDCVEIGYFAR